MSIDKIYLKNSDELPSPIAEQDSLFSGLPDELIAGITPAKMQVINLFLTGSYSRTKMANIIGVTIATINNWLHEDAVQAVIKELQQRELFLVQSNLNNLRNKAIDTMDELLDSNMDNVRFQAAKDVLDRSGLKATQSIRVDKTVTTLEQQLSDLVNFTISEDDVIDIDVDDIVSEVKSDGD